MKTQKWIQGGTAVAVIALFAGCSSMNSNEKTATGAGTGAVAGAVVAGPVGAVVGAGVGAVVGHENATDKGSDVSQNGRLARAASPYNESTVRSVQQSLSTKGYDVGPVDGQWGARTEVALRNFQTAQGLPATGGLDRETRARLGIDKPA
jgi:peptidoglycan hydrolase-like protein with peptidoglycan-binding domain